MKRKAAEIFDSSRLRPGQLEAVAVRRLKDARFLCGSGENARANGAMYLGGFVIECLLKARLLEKYSWLQSRTSPSEGNRAENILWRLCYQSHDLAGMLERLPEVLEELMAGNRSLARNLQAICSEWTIFARYSPKQATIADADDFLRTVEEVTPWLRTQQ